MFFTVGTFCSIITAVWAFYGAWYFPLEYGNENSVIEWAQIYVLAFGALLMIAANIFSLLNSNMKKVFLSAIPFWLVMAGRELSWGRALYHTGTDQLIAKSELWYFPYVYPAVAAMLIIALWGMYRGKVFSEMKSYFRYGKMPWLEMFVLVLSIGLSAYFDKAPMERAHVYEELSELVVYSTMVFLAMDIAYARKVQPVKPKYHF